MLVAHFLGVDHAGHSFSMDSEPMAAKLAEMDQVRVGGETGIVETTSD